MMKVLRKGKPNRLYSDSAGFTLIELLVVIAIIGVLASVVLVSLDSARASSRRAVRTNDLKQIQTALELYHLDFGTYPSTGGVWRSHCTSWGGRTDWIPGLAPNYIPVLPDDPTFTSPNTNCYIYRSNGTDYKFLIHAVAEMRANNSAGYKSIKTFIDPARDGGSNGSIVEITNNIWAWAVYTPRAITW